MRLQAQLLRYQLEQMLWLTQLQLHAVAASERSVVDDAEHDAARAAVEAAVEAEAGEPTDGVATDVAVMGGASMGDALSSAKQLLSELQQPSPAGVAADDTDAIIE